MYKNIQEVSIASLKKHCTLIQYFGLGFIQIKLGDVYRLHVYTSKLPAIVGDEDIHNHRYGFTSHILHGTFHQEIFSITEGHTHILEQESCKEGVHSDQKARMCGVHKLMDQTYTKGSSYHISHDVFHKVKADDAITFLKRDKVEKEFADVARAIDAPKVCPFSVKIPETKLWSMVEEILSRIK